MPASKTMTRSRPACALALASLALALAAGCGGSGGGLPYAPVNHVPGAQTTFQDVALVFSAANGNAITVQLPGRDEAAVALISVHGTVTLSGTAGLTLSAGTGTGDAAVAFSGAPAAVDAALEGLVFTPDAGFVGAATLRIDTRDASWPQFPWMRDVDEIAVTVAAHGEEQPPLAMDDTLTTAEDTAVEAGVLANDHDPDGDTLSVTAVTQGAHGAVALQAGGVVYTPSADYAGPDAFGYTVSDGRGGTASATVTVTVTAVNDPPVSSVPGPQDVNEESVLTFSTANGNAISVSDVDAGPANVQVALTATRGVVTLPSLTGLTITAGVNGTAALTVEGTLAAIDAALDGMTYGPDPVLGVQTIAMVQLVSSDLGNTGAGGPLTDSDSVDITVHPIEHAPSAVADAAPTAEDTAVDVDVLANDTDVDADPLTVSAAGPASHGTVSVVSGTHVRYTPAADFNGPDGFSYTISDGRGGTASSTVDVTVTAVNDPPVNGVPGAQDVNEDSLLTFSTAGGNAISVSDVDAGPATVQVALAATRGVVTLSRLTGLTVTAGGNGTGAVTVQGTLAAVNAALNGATFGPDAVHGGLTAAALQIASNDLGNGGTGGPLTDSDTVGITIHPVEHAPVAVADAATTAEDTAVDVDVLANDTDVDADPLTVTAAGPASHGTVSVVSGNRVRYTPAADYNGSDGFSYTISDGRGGAASSTVDVTVTAVNDPPVNGVPGSQELVEDATLTFSSAAGRAISISDVDAASATVQVALTATHGILTLPRLTGLTVTAGGNGTAALTIQGTLAAIDGALDGLTFSPDPVLGLQTRATIQVVSSDLGNTGAGGARTDADAIDITVDPVEHPPVAAADTGSTTEDTGVDVYVLTNDSDPDGDALSITEAGPASNGTVTVLSGTYVHYTPDRDFNGSDSFAYTVSDGRPGGTATADVTVTVNAVNDAPVNTVPGPQTVHAGAPLAFSTVGGNAMSVADLDAGPATVEVELTATHGTVSFPTTTGLAITGGANGTGAVTVRGTLVAINAALNGITFTSSPATFAGAASLAIATSDLGNTGSGGALIDTDTVAVTVTNQAPSAVDDSVPAVSPGVATDVHVLDNDSDPDGDTLTLQGVGTASHGTVAVNGAYARYTSSGGYAGPDSFTYTMADGHGATATATVRLRVNAAFTATGNTYASFTGLVQNDGVGAVVLTTGDVASAHGGTATLAADGSFGFLPARDHQGLDTFTYTLRDGAGVESTGTAEVTTGGMIWYVSADASVSGTRDGRSTLPYAALASAAAASHAGDSIYVAPAAGTYGGITLKNGQVLSSATTSDGGRTWVRTAQATIGSRPILGAAITLASGNTVTGLTLVRTGTTSIGLASGATGAGTTVLGRIDAHKVGVSDVVGGIVVDRSGTLEMTDVSLSGVTGDAVKLGALSSATLTHVVVDSPTGRGIVLSGDVGGFTLTRDAALAGKTGWSALTNTGGSALDLATGAQLTGTARVEYTTISTNAGDAVRVATTSGALALTVDNLEVTRAGGFGNGMLVRADARSGSTPTLTLAVTNSTFAGVAGDGINLATEGGAATMHATIGDTGPNTLANIPGAGGLGDSAVRVNASGAGASLYFKVIGNLISGWQGTAVSVTGVDNGGRLDGTVSDNRIGSGAAAPGSIYGDGIGVLLDPGASTSTMTGLVSLARNEIWVASTGTDGVFGLVRDGTGSASANRLDLVLDSNVVHSAGKGYEGVFLGASGSTTLCAALTSNASVPGADAGAGTVNAYLLQAPTPAGGSPSLVVEGVAAGSTKAVAEGYLTSTAHNGGTPLKLSFTGSLGDGISSCARPTLF
jgi:hypothetical protein